MNYFLNLELPLYWLFLPLVIAGLLADLTAALAVINRTGRAKAQWAKYTHAKAVKSLGQNAAIKKELQQVDMSTLEVGDKIVFKSGATHEVKSSYTPPNAAYFIGVVTNEGSDEVYCKNGNRYNLIETPSDIIKIIKQPKNN